MITVRRRELFGLEFVLKVEGHAGQAEPGQDIVCSAASILAYTLAQEIKFRHKDGHLEGEPTIVLEDGDATISCKVKKELEQDMRVVFDTIMSGFELIEHNYPQYLEILYVDDD